MYTVSKGPSKLVAKTRRGFPQNFEKIETMREINKKITEEDRNDLLSPKPVFQPAKKSISNLIYKTAHTRREEDISPQHEELINYIYESWNMISASYPFESLSSSECSSGPNSPTSSISSTTSSVYYTDPPSPVLIEFKPFDLEAWWGRRLFNKITKSL